MFRTNGNRPEIKSERPLTEGNEGHNRLKKVVKLNESWIVNKKIYPILNLILTSEGRGKKKTSLQRGIEP